MHYPYTTLYINGREESLDAICAGIVTAVSDFEEHTFSFIRDWLSGATEFEISTSGSTGTPKRMALTRAQMVASATLTQDTLGLRSGQNALICLDTRYIAGRMMIVRCFVTGMRMIVLEPGSNPFKSLPPAIDIHFVALVPLQAYEIVRSPFAARLARTDNIIIGGAALDADTAQLLQTFIGTCYATYAMTETISHVALRPLNGPRKDDNFHVLNDITIRLDDRGCLAIRAPYLREEVITNDLAEITGPGAFRWLGRYDNIINSGGVKIIPEHVEGIIQSVFQARGMSQRFFITSLPDARLGNRVVLMVEGDVPDPVAQTSLESALREKLHKTQMPKDILFVSVFEITETGKVNRNLTVKKYAKTL